MKATLKEKLDMDPQIMVQVADQPELQPVADSAAASCVPPSTR